MNKSIISPANGDIISNGHNSPECQTEIQLKNSKILSELEKPTSPKNICKDDLKSNLNERVKSYCRIRPFQGINKTFFRFTENTKEGINQFMNINRSSIKDKTLENLGSNFQFDYIFDEEFTQVEVFQETCMDLIKELVEDRKSSILFVNGLNNSGKTYTIVGDIDNPGLLPLSLRYVYDQVKEKNKNMIKMYCNYLEIDDENVYDLLTENEEEFSQVKLPLITSIPIYKDVNYFRLDTINDCSNAINIGNKRKKMKRSHSLTHTVFKIILRFFDNDEIFEEASLVFLDIAHQENKNFLNITHLDYKDNKHHMNKNPRDLHWQHESLCRMVKGLNMMKEVKFRHNRPTTDFCDLTILLRLYIFGYEKIVLISNINPSVEQTDENLKVLYFTSMFMDGIKLFDKRGNKTSKQVKFTMSHFQKNKNMRKKIMKIMDKDKDKETYSNQTENFLEKNDEKSYEKKIVLDKSNIENKDKGKNQVVRVEEEEKKAEGPSNISPIRLLADMKQEKEKEKEKCVPIKIKTPPKIFSLSEEEKNNLFNTLKKNAPKLDNKVKNLPFKNNISLIFHDKQTNENKKEANSNKCLNKFNEGSKLVDVEYEKMKKDYENLQKKFQEQEKVIKTILLKNTNLFDKNGEKENSKKCFISIDQRESEIERTEILADVQKILEHTNNKDSFEILNSSSQPESLKEEKCQKPEGRLYNIILMNPSIQNFNIMNRDMTCQKTQPENEKFGDNREKEKLKEGSVSFLKKITAPSKYDKEFLRENRDLISISEISHNEKNEAEVNFSPLKKKNSLTFQFNKNTVDKKKKSTKCQNKSNSRW